ncbi:MAG: hypothetical protein RR676_17495, partial [Acinetobacter sp.]
MKYLVYSLSLLSTFISFSASAESLAIQDYIQLAEQKKLEQNITWKRLLYAEDSPKSEVSYSGYFLASDGQNNIKNEMIAD